jgi:hypothetical protein
MSKGIKQFDGTYCYSGPNCQKHGGAKFKDAAGNPVASRDELIKRISDLSQQDDKYEEYFNERQNLEKIDKELAALPEVGTEPNQLIAPLIVDEKKLMSDFHERYGKGRFPHEKFAMTDSFSSGSHISKSDHYLTYTPSKTLGDNDASEVLDNYEAFATAEAIRLSEFAVLSKNAHDKFFTVTGNVVPKSGLALRVFVPDGKMIQTRANAAKDYNKWVKETSSTIVDNDISHVPLKETIEKLREKTQNRANTETKRFNSIRSELLYTLQTWDGSTMSEEEVTEKCAKDLVAVQRLHDNIVYSKLKERKLDEILKNAKN